MRMAPLRASLRILQDMEFLEPEVVEEKVFYFDVTGHLDDVMMCKVVDYVYPYHDDPVVTDKQGESPW